MVSRNLLLIGLSRKGTLFRSGKTPWRKESPPPFLGKEVNFHFFESHFFAHGNSAVLSECFQSLFSLDLAIMSVCPTRSRSHFFKLCYDCSASLKEGQKRKLIKFIHR